MSAAVSAPVSQAPGAEPDLNARIAELMEPKPAPVSARTLRDTYRDLFKGTYWVTTHPHPSPLGWWEAEIGSDHGPEAMDDAPVRWKVARDPEGDIADAWLVVEKMREDGYGFDLSSIEVDGGWGVLFDSQRTAFAGTTRRAPSAELAICLAALACVDAVRSASVPSRDAGGADQ